MQELQTERLLLRPWKESDVKDLFDYAKDERVGPNAGWKPHKDEGESKEVIQMFLESTDRLYAIELPGEGKVIGSLGLHDRKPDEKLAHMHQMEVGYVLHPSYWGKGYVPEAVNRVLQHAFEDLKLDVVWCGHYDFNQNSKRVNEKVGFNYRFSKNITLDRLDGQEVECLYYSILKSDYKKDLKTPS